MHHVVPTRIPRSLLALATLLGLLAPPVHAAVQGSATSFEVKINDATLGGGALDTDDGFGSAVESLGDLDGNGFQDVAIVARSDDDQGSASGAIYVLYLDQDGTLDRPPVKITVPGVQQFAEEGLAFLGDYDGDGNVELAVGADFYPTGSNNSGKVSIIDLDPATGAYQSHWEIRSGEPANFTALASVDRFGYGIANLGDWNGDGAPEIGVSSISDSDGGTDTGALYVLYLSPPPAPSTDASGIETWSKFSDSSGLGGTLAAGDFFGTGITRIPDLDGDGYDEIAVGASNRGFGGTVHVLFMDPGCFAALPGPPVVPNPACQIASFVEIGGSTGVLTPTAQLGSADRFGISVAWVPDDSGYRTDFLAVGAQGTNSGFDDRGAVWLLTLASDGTPTSARILEQDGSQLAGLQNNDFFGHRVTGIGDLDGDGSADLVVGALGDDDGAGNAGAAYLIGLSPCERLLHIPVVYHSPNNDGVRFCPPPQLPSPPPPLQLFVDAGDIATANPMDVCVEGAGEGDELCAFEVHLELEDGLTIQSFISASVAPPVPGIAYVTGARTNNPPPGATEFVLAWVAPSPAPLGPIKLGNLVIAGTPGPAGAIRVGAKSGVVDASLGYRIMARDTIALPEPGGFALLAGIGLLATLRARRRRRGLLAVVAVVCLASGAAVPASAQSIKEFTILRETAVLNWPPAVDDELGAGIAAIDLDGDGFPEWLAGAPENFAQCNGEENAWIIFTDEDLVPVGFEGPIARTAETNNLGWSVAALDDFDADGNLEVAIGAPGCSNNPLKGSVILVDLVTGTGPDAGNEASRLRISEGVGDTTDNLVIADDDYFGYSLANLGDLDGDGAIELAVGAYADDDAGSNAGAVWILTLGGAQGEVTQTWKLNGSSLGFSGPLEPGDLFGEAVASLGDLDGNGTNDLAVTARRDDDGGTDRGAVWILFLASTSPGNLSVVSSQKISSTAGGFAEAGGVMNNLEGYGRSVAFRPFGPGEGGLLYVGSCSSGGVGVTECTGALFVHYIDASGTVRRVYKLSESSGHGFAENGEDFRNFGKSVAVVGDLGTDEIPDIAVSAKRSYSAQGAVFLMELLDADFDGLDDVLDNCPFVSNRLQEDADGDGVGDLCDNCVAVSNPANSVATDCNGDLDTVDPGEAVGEQCDVDDDGEGDVCEPVELLLETTGTPAAPSWDLSLQCGAFDVTGVDAAIVLPAGSTAPQTLAPNGGVVASSTITGPGLSSPMRSDAIYFSMNGPGTPPNTPLCAALDPPVLLGTLTTGAIGGTQLAAAALSVEGTTGNLAEDALGAIPLTEIRLVNGLPLPVLDLELGPAVTTAGGTRWDVLLRNAGDEFHRVAFGLIAPAGTTDAQMRWVGCDTTTEPDGERACTGGTGFGTTANAANSWTVGPEASPAGTQLPHTLYVVLEGNRPSFGSLFTLNPFNGPTTVVLGTVELDGSPDLEPALTVDGVNDVDDKLNPGNPVTPFEEADFDTPLPTQVKLIGAFNPADDVDGDGVQDLGDNCPFEANPAQTNRGSFLDASDDSDALGDACQCAEATDDGAVFDPGDVDEIFDYLAGRPTATPAAEIEARCSVAGTTECNIRDLVFLKQAIAAMDPSVEIRCDAALSPPNAP